VIEVLAAVVILLAAFLTEKASEKWKTPAWIILVVLVFAQAALQVYTRNEEKKASSERESKLTQSLDSLNGQLQSSRIQQAQTNGQLQSVQLIMGNLGKSGVPGMKEFAAAIGGLTRSNSIKNEYEQDTDAELCKRANAEATKIRVFQKSFEDDRRDVDALAFGVRGKTTEESREIFAKQRVEDDHRRNAHELDFINSYMPEAKFLHDKIMDRLTVTQRDSLTTHNSPAETNLTYTMMAGAFSEDKIAAYLNDMAKELCHEH
jgi:hypothetical protein